jgi:hypothetical protein
LANPDKSGRCRDLILPSILVFALLIARACIQSVTIDEADAFTAFATRDSGLMWYPVAQNFMVAVTPVALIPYGRVTFSMCRSSAWVFTSRR